MNKYANSLPENFVLPKGYVFVEPDELLDKNCYWVSRQYPDGPLESFGKSPVWPYWRNKYAQQSLFPVIRKLINGVDMRYADY